MQRFIAGPASLLVMVWSLFDLYASVESPQYILHIHVLVYEWGQRVDDQLPEVKKWSLFRCRRAFCLEL